jgi:hypothetical protein
MIVWIGAFAKDGQVFLVTPRRHKQPMSGIEVCISKD